MNMFWRFLGKAWLTERLSAEGVWRTAPATPGLLKTCQFWWQSCRWLCSLVRCWYLCKRPVYWGTPHSIHSPGEYLTRRAAKTGRKGQKEIILFRKWKFRIPACLLSFTVSWRMLGSWKPGPQAPHNALPPFYIFFCFPEKTGQVCQISEIDQKITQKKHSN